MSKKVVTLSDALVNLRKDLRTAEEKAKDEGLRFKVEDIEVEFLVTSGIEGTGTAGADFWVLSTKASGKKSKRVSHKVKLRLKPELEGGGDLKVGGTIPSEAP